MDKIEFTINAWKSKLLDLTKRNRALNFKPNKVSTVTLVDEHPPEIFRLLCLRNKALKFKAAPEGRSRGGSATAPEAAGPARGDEEDDLPSFPDFQPYDAGTLDPRHTDDVLQTTSTAENLDKSLRRLDEQARLSIE